MDVGHIALFLTLDLMARIFSPYDLNPSGANPLRDILPSCIDSGTREGADPAVRHRNQRSHRARARLPQCGADAGYLFASACLPTIFQAIEIEGEAYWDGGYAGNPTITPLVRECASSDTVLVQVNPVERPARRAAPAISSTASMRFRSTQAIQGAAHDRGAASGGRCRAAVRVRAGRACVSIASRATMTNLGHSSKLNAEWEFFAMLRDEGRRSAESFLDAHAWDLGVRSTLDLDALLDHI